MINYYDKINLLILNEQPGTILKENFYFINLNYR
jgi:hypothetical protein